MTAATIEAPPYRSPEWHEWRQHGIGASEMADLFGCGYHTEYELWWEKKHGGERESTDVMRFGAFIESYALDRYEEDNGVRLVRGETFADDRYPHLWATLDGRTPDRIGVEVKYDSKGWDVVPDKHQVQALAQIGLGDLVAVDILRVDTRGKVTPFRIERDDATIGHLLTYAETWWARYVIGDEEPPLDGSAAARKALDRLIGTDEREANDDQRTLLADLRSVRSRLDILTKAEESIVRDLKASMAGTGVLTAPGARVTWAPVKGRRTTDWKAAWADITAAAIDDGWTTTEEVARRQEQHTTTGEPTTRFAVKYEEE